MTEKRPNILILGGGFGGLYTALRLSQLPWESFLVPNITLVDQQSRFLFAPFLYELVTEEMQTWEIAPSFEELLINTGIHFLQAKVTAIDIDQQTVTFANTNSLNYDYLVIATGGETAIPTLPGVKDHALPFRTLEDAYALKQKLRILEQSPAEKIRVAIVGGGYNGVELACKIGDRLGKKGKIRVIERGEMILANSTEYNRQTALEALSQRKIWLDTETEVSEVTNDSISLIYKGQTDTIPVELVLWTVGNQISPLIRNLPLPHHAKGSLLTNTYLQVTDYPHIYAIGDVAHCLDATGQLVPATAQVAFQQSDYCAWNIWADITHRPYLPFRYQALGEMLSLGLLDATLSGLGLKFNGPAAAIARRLVYLYRFPTWQQQLTVGLNWLTQPLMAFLR